MRNLKNKKISFVIVPEKSTKIRRFSISYLTAYFMVFLAVAVLGTVIGILLRFKHLNNEIKIVSEVINENQQLHAEHKTLKSDIEEITQELEELRNLDTRIRMMIGLKSSDELFSGIGGPFEESIDEAFDLSNKDQLNRLKIIREKIIAEAQYNIIQQEKSMVVLKDYMESQSSLLSSTPSIWPVKGFISSGFGPRRSPFTGRIDMHQGIDISGPEGTPVVTTADGVVIRSEFNKYGYGNLIVVNHGYGFTTKYGHLQKNMVKVGDKVKRGQVIGYRGNTGRSTGTHLHYEVEMNNVPVNPLNYIIDYSLK